MYTEYKEELDQLDEELMLEQFLNEIAEIGDLDKEYEVWVRTNDPGNKPHFHIWDANSHGKKFHTCVEILRPKYFHHTGKEGVLNSSERKELIRFLQAPSEDKPERTNWQMLLLMWNMNNSQMKVSRDLEMPDYRDMR